MSDRDSVEINDDEGDAEHISFDELMAAPAAVPEEAQEAPVPAPEPETTETTEDVAPEGPITSEDGTESVAPDGFAFAIYTGSADAATIGEVKMKPGVPALVSKEQSLTLLTHPFESFVITDRVLIEAVDEE